MTKMFFVLFSLIMCNMVMAAESSLYNFSWLDKDKEIYVLQNRKFRKDGQVYIGGNAGKTLSGAFINAYGVSARAGYFFREDWGIELVYGKGMGEENNTAKGIREQGTVPYYRKVDSYLGGMLMWSPFYSKINAFNKIFYYDWLFGAGVTNITTKDNRARFINQNNSTLTSETSVGLIWTTGMRFYIDEHWSARLDFTGMNWRADRYGKPTGASTVQKKTDWFNNYDVALGLNYAF
jgi:outer membrane beta-barrel protein